MSARGQIIGVRMVAYNLVLMMHFSVACGLRAGLPHARISVRHSNRRASLVAVGDMRFNATRLFEDAVRGVSGNDEYRFGDITRAAVTNLTGKSAEEYEFGDITRKAVTGITGKEGYAFGDISRAALANADQTITSARDKYFDELPAALWKRLFDGLSSAQRADVTIALCQLLAVALLSYSLVANLSLGLLSTVAWGLTSHRSGFSPLAGQGEWAAFLRTIQTLRLALEAPLLPARALATLAILPYYRRATSALQRWLPLHDSEPVLNRALALVVAWLVGNVAGVAGATALGIQLTSFISRVPIWSE